MTAIGPTEFGDYVFPYWADLLGWLIGASTLVPFFIVLAYRLFKGTVSIRVISIIFSFSYCTFIFENFITEIEKAKKKKIVASK